MLEIVDRIGSSNNHKWTLSQYIRDLIKRANLYITPEELERIQPTFTEHEPKRKLKIRTKRQKKKITIKSKRKKGSK